MWRKVKTFFHVFQGSIFPQPAYYHKITKASLRFSFKYFLSLIFILNFIFVGFFVFKYNPKKISKSLKTTAQEVSAIPEELVVNVNKGSLFTNFNRPYFLWMTYNDQKKLLLVVDETASPEKVNIYNTYILATGRELVFKNGQTLALKNFGKLTLAKKDFEKINNVLQKTDKFIYFFYFLSIPCLLIFLNALSFLITLFYLAIISLLVYLFFKTYYHKRIHFKKTLQISFHAVTFPLIVDYFLNIFQPTLPASIHFKLFIPAPFAFLIILAIFVFAAVYEAYEVKHHPS